MNRAFFRVTEQTGYRLLPLVVGIVAGGVLLFIFVATNQPPANNADSSTYYGTFAATQQPTGHCTTTDNRAFGFIAPAFFRRLSLGTAQQYEKCENAQKTYFESLHDKWVRREISDRVLTRPGKSSCI